MFTCWCNFTFFKGMFEKKLYISILCLTFFEYFFFGTESELLSILQVFYMKAGKNLELIMIPACHTHDQGIKTRGNSC